jgi:hypothetical protein
VLNKLHVDEASKMLCNAYSEDARFVYIITAPGEKRAKILELYFKVLIGKPTPHMSRENNILPKHYLITVEHFIESGHTVWGLFKAKTKLIGLSLWIPPGN